MQRRRLGSCGVLASRPPSQSCTTTDTAEQAVEAGAEQAAVAAVAFLGDKQAARSERSAMERRAAPRPRGHRDPGGRAARRRDLRDEHRDSDSEDGVSGVPDDMGRGGRRRGGGGRTAPSVFACPQQSTSTVRGLGGQCDQRHRGLVPAQHLREEQTSSAPTWPSRCPGCAGCVCSWRGWWPCSG